MPATPFLGSIDGTVVFNLWNACKIASVFLIFSTELYAKEI